MIMRLKSVVLVGTLASAIGVCGVAMADEPTEAQVKDPALFAINRPPDIANSEPITIKFFKMVACDAPTPRGYNREFDWQVQVALSNIGASIYNNTSNALFYFDKDAGKWAMRPPF
jgi:hypothetical protein